MVGDVAAALASSAAELEALHLPPTSGGTALDLGAGFGLRALPLAQRGYAVTAMDSCQALLDELRARASGLSIKTIHADITAFASHVKEPLDVILCMGDTLTHLPDLAAVETLLAQAAASLTPAGMFAATFRDYVASPLQAERRFVLVRSDARRILTCFLEYGPQHVTVYDLLYERAGAHWRQRLSSYPKLRLDPQWVVAKLAALGFAVRREVGPAGLVRLVATGAWRTSRSPMVYAESGLRKRSPLRARRSAPGSQD